MFCSVGLLYYETHGHAVERTNERRRAMMGMRASSFVRTESRAASYVRELAVFFHASIVVTTCSRELLLGTDSKAKNLSLSFFQSARLVFYHSMPPWKPFKRLFSLSLSLATQHSSSRERTKRISMSITKEEGRGDFCLSHYASMIPLNLYFLSFPFFLCSYPTGEGFQVHVSNRHGL